jgi:hypothetical protein
VSLLGIDIAWDRPTVAQIQATGAHWVARYFSQDPTKDITAGEVQQYSAANLGIVTVYETTTGRALQGFNAGQQDAHAAINERAAVGLPQTHPIYFAVDTDTDWASVKSYFDGVTSVLPKDLTGIYGGFKVVEGAHSYGLKYGWQTIAWSGGLWSQWASIKQTGGTVLSGGADIDFAEVPDFGQFPSPEVDMPLTDADVQKIWAYQVKDVENGSMVQMGTIMAYMDYMHKRQENLITSVGNQEAAIQAAITKLSNGGVDPTVLAQDVIKDLSAALAKA